MCHVVGFYADGTAIHQCVEPPLNESQCRRVVTLVYSNKPLGSALAGHRALAGRRAPPSTLSATAATAYGYPGQLWTQGIPSVNFDVSYMQTYHLSHILDDNVKFLALAAINKLLIDVFGEGLPVAAANQRNVHYVRGLSQR
jgi:hypothetical protein